MQRETQCLGCKTYFEQNEKLPLQGILIEFKNFPIPLKESKHKWILLKTITAFLNTKGGTIYIGVDDSDGKVIGWHINRKQQDQFKLLLKQLIERIDPPVDLMQKEQVNVYYVPIVKNKIFQGKYAVKIVVRQGDPSKLYCFSQKLQLVAQDRKQKVQEYEIIYTYRRHNMGGLQQAKGMKLVQCARKKAASPNAVYECSHEDCNPQPANFEKQIVKIAFGGIKKGPLKDKLEQIFHSQLQQMKIQYQLTYDVDNNVIFIQFDSKQKYEQVNKFIRAHISQLNSGQNDIQFVERGEYLNYNLYENIKSKPKEIKVTISKASTQYNPINDPNISQTQKRQAQIPVKNQQNKDSYQLIITHIQPSQSGSLVQFLRKMTKIIFAEKVYKNSIELFFNTSEQQDNFYMACKNYNRQLKNFGFNGQIRYGYPTNRLHILGYDKNKKKQVINYLTKLMGKDQVQINFKKENNKYILEIVMASKSLDCKWLDRLLNDSKIKQFSIPGAGKIGSHVPKMKIFVHCLAEPL